MHEVARIDNVHVLIMLTRDGKTKANKTHCLSEKFNFKLSFQLDIVILRLLKRVQVRWRLFLRTIDFCMMNSSSALKILSTECPATPWQFAISSIVEARRMIWP